VVELSNEKRGLAIFVVVATLALMSREMFRQNALRRAGDDLGVNNLPRRQAYSTPPSSGGASDAPQNPPVLAPPDSSHIVSRVPGLERSRPRDETAADQRDSSYGGASPASGSGTGGGAPARLGGGPSWEMPGGGGGSRASASAGSFGAGGGARPGAPRPGGSPASPARPVAGGGGGGGGGGPVASARAPGGGLGPGGAVAKAKAAAAAAGGAPDAGGPMGGLGGSKLGALSGMGGGGDGGAGPGGSDAAAPELSGAAAADIAKPTVGADAGSGKGDAPGAGGGGAGGGGGGGGGAGTGAAAKGAAPAATPPTAPSGLNGGQLSGLGGGSSDSPDATDPPDPVAPTPAIGVPPVPAGAKAAPGTFTSHAKPPQPVALQTIATPAGQAIVAPSGMTIDADGAGNAYQSDPDGKPKTALNFPNGSSLNPKTIPYVVIPPDFPGAKLGDLVAVSYRGRTIFAIVGDVGPPGVVGECSMSCAAGLAINPSPTSGGVKDGVTYTFLAGSRPKPLPTTAAQIQKIGAAAFAAAHLAPGQTQ
jgi:hypothetical protein